jgi:hypothetical protein
MSMFPYFVMLSFQSCLPEDTELRDDGVRAIIDLLELNHNIQEINLASNGITSDR